MTTFIDATVSDIDERLRQATEEMSRLQRARSALVGNETAPKSAAANGEGQRRRRRRAPGQRRGRRGVRGEQVLELLRESPGMKIPELAAKMQIEPNYLYRVLPPLEKQGKIVRDEAKRWSLAS